MLRPPILGSSNRRTVRQHRWYATLPEAPPSPGRAVPPGGAVALHELPQRPQEPHSHALSVLRLSRTILYPIRQNWTRDRVYQKGGGGGD